MNPFNFKKGISIKNIYSMRTEYIVVGFSESKKEHHFFWLEITQWYFFLHKFILEFLADEKIDRKRNLFFKEIKEADIVKSLKDNYKKTIRVIKDRCPACQNLISEKTNECPNCGLNLKA
jgi:rubrerythrin